MKKLFSFVLLTGMLTLMSFGSAKNVGIENQLEGGFLNCWDVADAYASAMAVIYPMSAEQENDLFFDSFEECNARSGMSGIDDEPFNSTVNL